MSGSGYRMERRVIELQIVHIVRGLQRRMGRGILPVDVQPWLVGYRAEQTLRMDMMRLVDEGYLERIGGDGSRRGYRVA